MYTENHRLLLIDRHIIRARNTPIHTQGGIVKCIIRNG